MKRLIKLIGIILLIFFLALYLSSYNTSYYENKNILTEDAIKRFEKDLKEGKAEPHSCGKCDFCKFHKKLDKILDYRDLNME